MKDIFITISVFLVLVYIFAVFVVGPPPECITKKIIQIGGCDRGGRCGVQYEDGSRGKWSYPTLGETIEVCYRK